MLFFHQNCYYNWKWFDIDIEWTIEMKTRLALDLGTTSIGWSLFEMDEAGSISNLVDLGVRIFPNSRDSQTNQSLASERRAGRTARRRRDRKINKEERLLEFLIDNGLFPKRRKDQEILKRKNVYELRAKALDDKLASYELGRALMHIVQRIGFKSNRKTDSETDSSVMKTSISELRQQMISSDARTLGEYLYNKQKQNPMATLRIRSSSKNGGSIDGYNFYTDRAMYESEIDQILSKQQEFHENLTDEICQKIKTIILFQRPLKLKGDDVGTCTFEDGEKRARNAYPIVQERRIREDVNKLDFIDPVNQSTMSDDQRQQIIDKLQQGKNLTFDQIRKMIKVSIAFNLEKGIKKDIKGNVTNKIMSDKKRFGSKWDSYTQEQQIQIIDWLFDEQDSKELSEKIKQFDISLSDTQIEKIVESTSKLPQGYCSLSLVAINNLLPYLRNGQKYHEACKSAGYHHSDFRTGECFDSLPYYGRVLTSSVVGGTGNSEDLAAGLVEKYYGKISNPTVHVVLNQVRKLVNAIIEQHGKPDQIVIETARELKSPSQVAEYKRRQNKNAKENDKINEELRKIRITESYENRMKYKIWEDCNKICVFSGETISIRDLFSGEYEVDHIIPFSKSFDDNITNKILIRRDWNQAKGNRTPFEAFGHKADWSNICNRVSQLPKNKQWRFAKDAIEKFEKDGRITDRVVGDTHYISRIVKKYLSSVFDDEIGSSKVWTVNGRITAWIRRHWGLDRLVNSVFEDNVRELFQEISKMDALNKRLDIFQPTMDKNRNHYLHHAVDAFVIGCIDRGFIQRIMVASKSSMEDTQKRKLIQKTPEPFDGFRNVLHDHLYNLIVSHKQDHGYKGGKLRTDEEYTTAKLHEDTAYSPKRKIIDSNGQEIQAHCIRKKVVDLLTRKQIHAIVDPYIRDEFLKALADCKEGSTEWKQCLDNLSKPGVIRTHGIVTLKIYTNVNPKIVIKDENGQEYKFYDAGGNYRADIYYETVGKKAGKWQIEVISNFDANQPNFVPQWQRNHPTAKKVMHLQLGEMVEWESNGKKYVCRVECLSNEKNGVKIKLCHHAMAVSLGRPLFSGKQLQEKNIRKIRINEIGKKW